MSDLQQQAEFSQIACFIKNMYLLVDVINDRLENVVKEDSHRVSTLLDGEKPRNMYHAYLVTRACRLMYELESVTMSEITKNLQIEKYVCTRLVVWMNEKGLVERNNDPKDKRIVRVSLTPRGEQLHGVMDHALLYEIGCVLEKLTKDEQIILTTLLGKLVSV